MLFIFLSLIVQIGCAVHVVRTGRELYWIFLILIAPGIGSAVYIITQVLPGMGSGRTARRVGAGTVKLLDPTREYRAALQAFDMVESVENRLRLADALIALGRWHEAEPHVATCLMGHGANDPHILMRMARIRLETGDAAEAIRLLDHLQASNKGFQSQDGHLLYARAQAAAGDRTGAIESYANLVGYATGEEARVRYATLLKEDGQADAARAVFEETLARGRRGTSHYRRDQKSWIAEAQRQLQVS
ncbi:MAG: hypothetical protein EP335_18245 [Alphaproteobacteria bacterium]|nr:MAG: hypothetical protein EP335_18245 [Alphaproteobacteria bacterium]